MRYLIALVAAVLLFPQVVQATAQEPDTIVLEGEELPLHTNPLQPYLHAHPGEVPEFQPTTSANWRGYVATFVVRNDVLIVEKVEVVDEEILARRRELDEWEGFSMSSAMKDVITEVFDGRDDVPATWYTGALVIPRGERIHYVHMGYGSTYEHYTLLDVQEGRVVERLELDAEEFTEYRRERFEAFKKTPAFARRLEDLRSGEHALGRKEAEELIYELPAEDYLSSELP